jgi:ABC-2 type transport system permease protein
MTKKTNRGLSFALIRYELRNTYGNSIALFFSLIFPIFMSVLFANVVFANDGIPAAQMGNIKTAIFLAYMTLIPLAMMFIGYAATYSQELEQNVPLRLNLFGISRNTIFLAKFISYMLSMLASIAIYAAVDPNMIQGISAPVNFGAAAIVVGIMVLLGAIMLIMAHSIASMTKKFSRTYGITMTLYFGMMILGGMMGVQVSQLTGVWKNIANLLPITYIGNGGLAAIWHGAAAYDMNKGTFTAGNYDPSALIWSFVVFALAAAALFGLSLYVDRRKK